LGQLRRVGEASLGHQMGQGNLVAFGWRMVAQWGRQTEYIPYKMHWFCNMFLLSLSSESRNVSIVLVFSWVGSLSYVYRF
jgi:hypothetical protein